MPPRRSAATSPPRFALHLARSRSTVDGLDAGKLLSAMRVLRREHDPKLAEELLAQYRAHHPSNELSEEALALAIEAAAIRNRVVTAELAAEYLRRFPRGRFSALAVEARARFGHGAVP